MEEHGLRQPTVLGEEQEYIWVLGYWNAGRSIGKPFRAFNIPLFLYSIIPYFDTRLS